MRIEIENLHFTYPSGVQALQGVTLTVAPGEQVAMIGQNGSGKTTLVKQLNGLLRPTQGMVRIGDWATTEHSGAQLAARVGYVFQNPDDQLFKSTVRDEVKFGPSNLRLPAQQSESLVQAALDLLNLTDKAAVNPYDLTATWRKRVAMAAVIAMNTPIIVFDEPTTGQDYQSVQMLAGVLRHLKAQGKTIITISHDIDFVAENFGRIIAMAQGKVLIDGDASTVFAQGELLNKTYVEPPQLTRLGNRLGFAQPVYTVDGFLDRLRKVE